MRMSPILQRAVRAAMSPDMVEQSAGRGGSAAGVLAEAEPRHWIGQSLRASAACLRRATGGLLWAAVASAALRAGQSLDEASLTGPAVDYWAELTSIGDQVFGPGHPESMVTVERLGERLRDGWPRLRGRRVVPADNGGMGQGLRARPSADSSGPGQAGASAGDRRAV